jgi:hypothetical protein
MIDTSWESRIAAAWASLDDDTDPETFRTLIDSLAAELPQGSAIGLFERACAFDSTSHSDKAVPLYRQALHVGLEGIRRRRAVIQMSSSLRNIGDAAQAVELLTAELEQPSDELDDAVHAVLALCLVELGRGREAVSHAVGALAKHLPRYQRSMANYARLLVSTEG